MKTNETSAIILKFQELKSEFDTIIEDDKWWTIDNNFTSFLEKIDSEITLLPETQETICELYAWMSVLSYRMDKAKHKNATSDLTRIRSQVCKSLLQKLGEIRAGLLTKSNPVEDTNDERTLTLKQQILLLKVIGILEMEDIKTLPLTKQARFFSALLGRSNKKVKDILTYIDDKKARADFFVYKNENVKKINELLQSIDLQKHIIKS